MTEKAPDLADALLASMAEALAHARDADNGTRVTRVEMGAPQVRSIRHRLGLSQERFAALLGVSVSGLRKWEQGTRKPTGAAATLLQVMESEPEAVSRALTSIGRDGRRPASE